MIQADNDWFDSGGSFENLKTADYDVVNRSCLTHVFDTLRVGGVENVPKNSDAKDRSVRKFMVQLMKGEQNGE